MDGVRVGVNAGAAAENIGEHGLSRRCGGVGDGGGAGSAHRLVYDVSFRQCGGVGDGGGAGSAHKLEDDMSFRRCGGVGVGAGAGSAHRLVEWESSR